VALSTAETDRLQQGLEKHLAEAQAQLTSAGVCLVSTSTKRAETYEHICEALFHVWQALERSQGR
jgi:hypothetical protein